MRGQVYRIDFPNGYFYIGKSKNLETRILQHYSGIDGRLYKLIRECCDSGKDLLRRTTVIYSGIDYVTKEFFYISKYKDNIKLLNIDLVEVDLFREYALSRGLSLKELAASLNISINDLDKIRKEPPSILKERIKTWESLVNKLNNLELELKK